MKRIVGKKTILSLLGVEMAELVSREEYPVKVNDSAADQWRQKSERMDKVFAAGHRNRGDVGVLV